MAKYRVVENKDFHEFMPQVKRWWWPFWVSIFAGQDWSKIRRNGYLTLSEASNACVWHRKRSQPTNNNDILIHHIKEMNSSR
jgi:hypothetical protein